MAEFIKLNEKFLPSDGDWYRVSGIITSEDIERINAMPRKSVFVLENTRGVDPSLIERITSLNVSFSIVGGLDYFNKEKYRTDEYINRTLMSPSGLAKVIKYYESIESRMLPEWSDVQKCMFLYDALTRDFTYEENYATQIKKGVAERGLNGILYKKLVCSGFAFVFKEGLDRIGIKNYYQNRKNKHSWNIVELDGKLRGIELTWECFNKRSDNECHYNYFGVDENFYGNKDHSLMEVELSFDDFEMDSSENRMVLIDPEEPVYDLTPFTAKELNEYYNGIRNAIVQRKAEPEQLFASAEEEIKMFPIDRIRYVHQKQCGKEQYYIMLYQFLKNNNQLSVDYEALKVRNGYVADMLHPMEYSAFVERVNSFSGKDIGIPSLRGCVFNSNGDYRTPFGSKFAVIGRNEVVSEKELSEVFELLRRRLDEYIKEFLIDILKSSESILSTYKQLQELGVSKDLNIAIIEANLFTKLRALLISKDLLIRFGVPKEVIDQRVGMIEAYFDSLRLSSEMTPEQKKENDMDFLYGVLSDTSELRRICEQHEGHQMSEEEWQQNCVDAHYIIQVLNKLSELGIKEEYVQEVLNDIFLGNNKGNGIKK